MPGIFISYRREDSAGHAGRLFDRLRTRLGRDRVFMDVAGIEAGVDFVDTIERAIGSCDALLAVIGPEWLTCTDTTGRPRLGDPNDFIRIEIGSALKRQVRVIPVLVGGALMPPAQALPDDLKLLTRRQAVELRDTRWDSDADDLMGVLEHVLEGSAPAQKKLPPTRAGRGRWMIAAVVALTVVLMLTLAWKLQIVGPEKEDRLTKADPPGIQAQPARPQGEPPKPIIETAVPRPADSAQDRPGPPAVREIRVPDVVGLPLEGAAQAIRNAKLIVGAETSTSAPGTKAFVVTKQTPAGGTSIAGGGRVDLEYSGPTRTLPILTGRTLDEAIAELRQLGFEPGVLTTRLTDKVPAKQVLAQSRPAGSELEPGARIDLVYAAYSPEVAVPDVVGVDVRTAATTIQAAGLLSSRQGKPSPDARVGQVLSQTPPAGKQVASGTTVVLVYATRLPLQVPNVVDQQVRDAAPMLERMGFSVHVTWQDTVGVPAGRVMRQRPDAGGTMTGDKPTVELTAARQPGPPVGLAIRFHVTSDADRRTVKDLLSYLGGMRMARYDQDEGAPRPITEGRVTYPSEELEGLAKTIASRAGPWLSKEYGRRVSLTWQLSRGRTGDPIVLWLPDR